MKNRLLNLGLTVVTLSLISSPNASGAQGPGKGTDGASLYKSKCAQCHGAKGEGKNGPRLKGAAKSSDEIVALLTKGDAQKKAPHSKTMAGMSQEKARAIADYLKTLQ